MPTPRKGAAVGAAPATQEQSPRRGSTPRKGEARGAAASTGGYEPPAQTEAEGSGPGLGTVAAGVGATAVGAALLSKLKNMSGIPGAIGKGASVINAIRSQLMLTGAAAPKSLLGNVGTGIEAAVEGKGLGALREILSTRTLKDAVQSTRTGAGAQLNPAGSRHVKLPWYLSMPGRVMGGLDEATQNALKRSGASADEAASATLQSPLPENFGKMGEVLENPAMDYLQPFRRTPFNAWGEGAKKYQRAYDGDKVAQRGTAIYTAAGAAHGAATSDETTPYSIPLGVAASSRYGLPYAMGALAGRALSGGKGGGGVASSALPVGEYGYTQSVTDPTRPFYDPAVLAALRRVTGGK